MSRDISRLNHYYPIHHYIEQILNINQVTYVYGKLGIIDYNDYIYNISSNANSLHAIITSNPYLQPKTFSVVLACGHSS